MHILVVCHCSLEEQPPEWETPASRAPAASSRAGLKDWCQQGSSVSRLVCILYAFEIWLKHCHIAIVFVEFIRKTHF